jgi:hypothetical protein
MPINFIPNDPLCLQSMPLRQQARRADRGHGVAGFKFLSPSDEGLFEPGTPQFLFNQGREAALAALEAWEALDGPLKRWSPEADDPRLLGLQVNAGEDLNAFYDRESCSFFAFVTDAKATYTAASTDCVAHEVGHALLDTVQPLLWDTQTVEAAAFHEAFGDCMAMLTAFADPQCCAKVLELSPGLASENFLETILEDLADGLRRAYGKDSPGSEPRHSLNTYQWQLPSTLPSSGGPRTLTAQPHSFGRVFTGCFYDAVRFVFQAMPRQDAASLAKAARTVGKLLITGAREAVVQDRYFQSVGRAMILADQRLNAGQYRDPLRKAFTGHSIALGSAMMFAPTAALAGEAPHVTKRTAQLPPAAMKDVLARLAAKSRARVDLTPREVEDKRVAELTHFREVELGSVHQKLKGVVAVVPESVLIGSSGDRAAVLGALPQQATSEDEVSAFVASLMANQQIEGVAPKRFAAAPSGFSASARKPLSTHTIRTRGSKRVLERVCFLCR